MDLFQDMNLKDKYNLYYRKVKHPRIEVYWDVIKIIVPENYSWDMWSFIHRYDNWIEEKLKRLKEIEVLSENLILYNHENLKEMVENCIEKYGKILRVKPEKISFRKMKNRWGSCKFSERRLIFNKNLKFLPEELISYVVLHEMCHLIVKNHGKEFWNLVARLEDEYKEREKFLMCYRFKLNQSQKGS